MPHDNPAALESHALKKLLSGLAEKEIRYAVLRNHEQLPDCVGSRDIDLLVHPKDLGRAKDCVIGLTNDLELSISDVFEDDMFFSMWLFKRLGQGQAFTLSVDLFPGRRVYGLELYSIDDALSNLRFHRGIPVVHERFVFLDKWLYHMVVGQPSPKKYDELFSRIASENFEILLKDVAAFIGCDEAEKKLMIVRSGRSSDIPAMTKRERMSMLLRRFHNNRGAGFAGIMTFLTYRLRDQLGSRGLFISVSGPDGSGKTTVIDMVIAQLDAIYGKGAVTYAHFRPTVLPRIAEVAKKARAVEKVDENYAEPHRAKPSGKTGSIARLCYYWLDYLGGYFSSVRPVLKLREVMLFDRYYYDMIADSFRSRIELPMPFLRAMGRLLPLPQYAFFIHVNPQEVHRRKQELTFEQIVELNSRYGDLADRGWLTRIDNNGGPDKAASAIIDHIVAERHVQAVRKLR
jgi:thymidylate kinase